MIWLLVLAASIIFLASTSGVVVSETVTSELDTAPSILAQETYIAPVLAEEPALLIKPTIDPYVSIDPVVSISPVVKEPEAFTPPVEVAPKVLIEPASTFLDIVPRSRTPIFI